MLLHIRPVPIRVSCKGVVLGFIVEETGNVMFNFGRRIPLTRTDIRKATREDSEELTNLFRKMDVAEMGAPMTTNTDVQNLLQESDIGSWVAVTASQIVAFGSLRTLSNSKEVRAQFGCLPERVNTASEMSEWLITNARNNGASQVSLWQVTGGIAALYLEKVGWKSVRKYIRMALDLTQSWSKPIAPSHDIEFIKATEEADFQIVHQLIEETLADHWDHNHLDFDTFMSTQATRPGYNRHLWYIAYLDDQPAGAIVGRLEGANGQIALLGTKEQFRGRGVGTALLYKAFTDLKSRGAMKVTLDVDSDNATNAVRVYEKVGMRAEFSSEQWKTQI